MLENSNYMSSNILKIRFDISNIDVLECIQGDLLKPLYFSDELQKVIEIRKENIVLRDIEKGFYKYGYANYRRRKILFRKDNIREFVEKNPQLKEYITFEDKEDEQHDSITKPDKETEQEKIRQIMKKHNIPKGDANNIRIAYLKDVEKLDYKKIGELLGFDYNDGMEASNNLRKRASDGRKLREQYKE